MRKFEFRWANGRGYGYGNTPRQAVMNLVTRNKKIITGELIQVYVKGINYYWDASMFHKALDHWNGGLDELQSIENVSQTDGE